MKDTNTKPSVVASCKQDILLSLGLQHSVVRTGRFSLAVPLHQVAIWKAKKDSVQLLPALVPYTAQQAFPAPPQR